MVTAPPPPGLLADAPKTRVLFYCHVMDPSPHRHAHNPPHLPFPFSCNSVFPFGWVGIVLLQTSGLGAVILRVAGGWREVVGPPHLAPVAFLSESCAWNCYPAGWLSGHRGDNAGYGMGCVVFVLEEVDG